MKIGIIGLPQVGKKTLFELLTEETLDAGAFSGKPEIKNGVAKVRDDRLEKLVAMYDPQRRVPATIDLVLLPQFNKEAVLSGEFLKSIEKCDALCHVVRAFTDESVFHAEGSVDPLRDADHIFTELILSDLILAEKRLERIALEQKKGGADPRQGKEQEILTRMKALLDENVSLINFSMSEEEKKLMSTYQFLTRKPMILALNVDDDKISDESLIKKIQEKYKDLGVMVMQISAKIEKELMSLPLDERDMFLQDLGIKESALNHLSALCFKALGLISFFTVGKDEVRAWTTPRGSTAPEAAGAIHSDLQRGFIRAEIMTCADLFEHGDELKLKEVGKLMLKGKDYVVEDGDIMQVRFNV